MDNHDFFKILVKEELGRQLLYEGLIFSYPPNVVLKKINRGCFKDVIYDGKTININFVLTDNNEERYKKLNDFLHNLCGWHHGVSIAGGVPMKDKLDFLNYDNGNVNLQYEAKFDIEAHDIPENLYHLTTCERLDKVLKKGLTPKTSTDYFNFENRIYLSKNKKYLINFAKQKSFINKTECFIILKVSLNGFTDRIRFFIDPNFNEGIYTLENIPKFVIKPIEQIDIDKENNISIKGLDKRYGR